MKNLLIPSCLLLLMLNAFSLPIFNKTHPNDSFLTLFPDHQSLPGAGGKVDKKWQGVLYAFPHSLEIAFSDENKPMIKYKEFETYDGTKAYLQFMIQPKYLNEKIAEVKRLDKSIKHISPVVLSKTELKFGFNNESIESQNCDLIGGQTESLMSCQIVLNPKGVSIFREVVKGSLNFLIHLKFNIDGYHIDGKNKLTKISKEHGVSGNLTNHYFFEYGELFLDSYGDPIFGVASNH